MKRARYQTGSVVFDKRRGTWAFLWREDGKRRSKLIGTKAEYPTKAAARRAAERMKPGLVAQLQQHQPMKTIKMLVEQYRAEKMPQRAMTRQGYNTWLNQYIIPKWGGCVIQELQARSVDLWLQSLHLAPKSKVHIRGMIRILWDFAMWHADVPVQRNPMELVTIAGASRRVRPKRSLSVKEFQQLSRELQGPFHTLALVCISFGLRISEALALRWSDVNWTNSTLNIERGIVHQKVDSVKTQESQRLMPIDPDMLEVLKLARLMSQFPADVDWIFASPSQLGQLPISYAGAWRTLRTAAERAGLEPLGWHTFRHTHRSWLDSVGTPVGIQQALMRHSDVRVTMNVYGLADQTAMRQAHGQIVRMALAQA
jgi:integrase